MVRQNFDSFKRVSYYARARTGSPILKVMLISLLFSLPVAAAELAFDAALAALKNPDLKTKYEGLEKMKTLRTVEAADAITKSALREHDPNFRLAALDKIAALQIPSVISQMGPLLSDKSAAVRQRAARVVGMVGGPSAEPLLVTAVAKETDLSVKAAQIQALGLCGSGKSLAILDTAAHDSNDAIRSNAQYAHKRLTGKEAH